MYIGVTNTQWFDYLRGLFFRIAARHPDPACPAERLDEVDFWQPSSDSLFRVTRIRGLGLNFTFSIKEIR